jgi:hypothetical protein
MRYSRIRSLYLKSPLLAGYKPIRSAYKWSVRVDIDAIRLEQLYAFLLRIELRDRRLEVAAYLET